MKRIIPLGFLGLLAAGSASAQSLYYLGTEAQESIPLKWVVGANVIFDDNISPGFGPEESSVGINPNVAMSFVSITPQTTWDVYVRLGLIYYFDAPDYMDDVNPQTRAGVNFVHRFSERLRFSSRNFIAYELEPDYSTGYSSSRQNGAYLLWQTDNSLGFRWTERFATYTGLRLTDTSYQDIPNNDRFTWEVYNQIRFQLSPQTVLTADYRYAQTTGNGYFTDTNDHYILVGAEHRFSPNTIGIVRAGVQLHEVEHGDNTVGPYVEFALNSQVTQQFSVRSYARYGIETYNNIQTLPFPIGAVEYGDVQVLRIGLSAEYAISPRFSIFGGVRFPTTTPTQALVSFTATTTATASASV
ncbi:MAG: hypothetical protein NTV46_17860 [Verrucomicrobia bacterium]|nr:hypothetical protein [Verrucomicrobiota bacterium]